MRVKDIVNRDIINLTNCEHEPIHIPGSIQPHGFLLGLKEHDFTIDFCSENCSDYIQATHQQLLGKNFFTVFGKDTEDKFKNFIDAGLKDVPASLMMNLNGIDFLCTVHKSGNIFVFECEPEMQEQHDVPDTFEQTRQFLSGIQQTQSLQQLCDSVVRSTRDITGYDRVMVYRFDEQYNGEVFAESVREDLEPFFGLHYPHTDIPPQARELYKRNLLRLIVDINYKPVPVFTVDDEDSKNLDLSISVLRSTSPIHVQYIQNMGVGATLTISLLHQHKLWGLIACHHYSQKNLSHQVRIAAQLQGHFLTSQIDVRQSNEEYIVSRKSNVALEKFLAVSFQHTYNSLNEIVADPQILEICNASGICVSVKDKFYKLGETPPDDAIKNLIIQLSDQHKVNGFHTHELSNFYRQTNSICNTASGILYHSLSITNNDSIIWFRRENITEVNWGGDPNKAIIKDEKGLHPRNSFKLWKEVVKCKSKPWLKPEINAAANFAYSLQKHVTLLALSAEEEKFRKLTEVLKENNDELENINWISTHDLQEPLRKIQIMSSRLMSYESSALTPKMTDLIVRMDKAANRMQTLLRDILSYTKIKHTNEILEQVDLNVIVAKAVSDAEENIRERNAEIILNELPSITGISFLMKQLFTNLLVNSLKFSDKERKQQITISAVEVAEQTNDTNSFYQITISDTGIGFEQKFAESIFQIFNRLHNQSDYQGSGVGLALCKKIMSIHNGNITANGKPGEGAEFILTFPVKLNNIQP